MRLKPAVLVVGVCLVASSGGSAVVASGRATERVTPAPELNANAVVWRTNEPPADPQSGDVWVNPKDGMEMVYISAGEFTLGTSDAQIEAWLKEHPSDKREWFAEEKPQSRVNLPGYWIGRTEVTNAQYLRFVRATGHRAPEHWKQGQIPSGLERFPVVFVDWEDARAYCEWTGGRLPSELEWEKAARGTDGRFFPWGSEWEAGRCRSFEVVLGSDIILGGAACRGCLALRAQHLGARPRHGARRSGSGRGPRGRCQPVRMPGHGRECVGMDGGRG